MYTHRIHLLCCSVLQCVAVCCTHMSETYVYIPIFDMRYRPNVAWVKRWQHRTIYTRKRTVYTQKTPESTCTDLIWDIFYGQQNLTVLRGNKIELFTRKRDLYMQSHKQTNKTNDMRTNIHIYMHICIHTYTHSSISSCIVCVNFRYLQFKIEIVTWYGMGWLRLVGCLKL